MVRYLYKYKGCIDKGIYYAQFLRSNFVRALPYLHNIDEQG
jgi:hypothetical protein